MKKWDRKVMLRRPGVKIRISEISEGEWSVKPSSQVV